MSNDTRIAEVFTLPSRGLIYEEEVDPEVVLSSMTTRHEMLRLSATEDSQKIMSQIIEDCLETDLGIPVYDLCLGDFQYLLFMLRVVTFGNKYELSGRCPFCGFEQLASVNLDELEVKEYDDALVDLMEIELPKSGNKIKLTLQTPRILDRISTKVKEYRRRHKDTDENPVILFNIMSSIEEIDGEKPNSFTLEEWIKDLPLADTNALINRIDLINNYIGINIETETGCKICGTTFAVPFRINQTFFRPRS